MQNKPRFLTDYMKGENIPEASHGWRIDWNIKTLLKTIDDLMKDLTIHQADEDGRVSLVLDTLASGQMGQHQKKHLYHMFKMAPPKDWDSEHPGEEYDPMEDEFIWDGIEEAAGKDANALLWVLSEDDGVAYALRGASCFGVSYEHLEADGSFCLCLWYDKALPEKEELCYQC